MCVCVCVCRLFRSALVPTANYSDTVKVAVIRYIIICGVFNKARADVHVKTEGNAKEKQSAEKKNTPRCLEQGSNLQFPAHQGWHSTH